LGAGGGETEWSGGYDIEVTFLLGYDGASLENYFPTFREVVVVSSSSVEMPVV
jgi:hypothetical protein